MRSFTKRNKEGKPAAKYSLNIFYYYYEYFYFQKYILPLNTVIHFYQNVFVKLNFLTFMCVFDDDMLKCLHLIICRALLLMNPKN